MARRRTKRSSGAASLDSSHLATTSSSFPSKIQHIFVYSPHLLVVMSSSAPIIRRGRHTRDLSLTEGIVAPGRTISKAEREARKDSGISREERHTQEPAEPPHPTNITEQDYWHPVLLPTYKHEFAPRPTRNFWARIRILDFAFTLILFLLTFGVFYVAVEYLLFRTRASAQCTPTTVYLPVTETETITSTLTSVQYLPASSSSASSSLPTPLALTTTLTTTVPYTQTVTVLATLASSLPASSSGQSSEAPLSYVVNDGTTSWLGASPSSGVSVVFASTMNTVTVVPTPPSAISHTTITTTVAITKFTTITLPSQAQTSSSDSQITPTATLPPFTSTVFSMVSPDITTTIFRTRYTTISLSRVTPHSSFTGINTSGWNTSTSAAQVAQPAQPTTRTFSELYYFGTGSATTSTSTLLITTTIGATITQTFMPTPFVFTASGTLITLTGTPAIITLTVQPDQPTVSMSIADAGSEATTSTSGAGPIIAPPSGLSSATIFSSTRLLPTESSQTFSIQPTGGPSLSSTMGPTFSNTSSSVSGQAANVPSTITVTSFVSGHGTTFVVESTPLETIPHSPLPSDSKLPTISSMASTGAGAPPGYGTANSSSSGALNSAVSSTSSVSGEATSIAPTSSFTTTLRETITLSEVASATSGSSTGPSSQGSAASTSQLSMSTPSNSKPASSSATHTSSSSFSNPFPATSATATPSRGCGEQGGFTMTFDDLPGFTPSKRQWNQTNSNTTDTTDITQYPPLNQRPYHHLFFSNGYLYAPSYAEPFAAVSSPNVAAFVEPNLLKSMPGSLPNMTEPGEIGDIPHGDDNTAFWFDPQSAFLGCDNDGPDDCIMEATGYTYDPKIKDEVPGPQQNYTLAPCIGFKNCKLQQVDFPPTFNNLSGIQFRAFVDNKPRMYFLDNLNMRWSNTSCAAGMERQATR